MRRITTLLLITLTFQLYSQDYKIKNIEYKPIDYKFEGYYPISYPIFKLTDSTTINYINSEIKKVTLDCWLEDFDSTFTDILSEIKFLMKNRDLYAYEYEIVFNKVNLISIETNVNIINRADWHIRKQFNIDIKLGKVLSIDDIVCKEKRNFLDSIILKRKIVWLNKSYKVIQDSLNIGKEAEFKRIYKRGLEEIDYCINKRMEITGFLIKNNGILFFDNCELSTSVLNVCPFSTESESNQKFELKGIIKDEYYNLIFNK